MTYDELQDFLHLTEKHLAAMKKRDAVPATVIQKLEADAADIRRDIERRIAEGARKH